MRRTASVYYVGAGLLTVRAGNSVWGTDQGISTQRGAVCGSPVLLWPQYVGMGTLCTAKKPPIYGHGDTLHCQKAPGACLATGRGGGMFCILHPLSKPEPKTKSLYGKMKITTGKGEGVGAEAKGLGVGVGVGVGAGVGVGVTECRAVGVGVDVWGWGWLRV